MRPLFFLFLLIIFAVSGLAIAQVPGEVTPPVTAGEWDAFLAAIGGVRGAGVMGVIVAVIQTLLLVLRSPLGFLAGPYKLILIAALTMFLGVSGLRVEGFDWQTALMHSTTLTSFQVFLHQLWKQMVEAKQKSS